MGSEVRGQVNKCKRWCDEMAGVIMEVLWYIIQV